MTWRSNVRAITRSPKRLKQCADYVAAHADRIAVSTVAELAEALSQTSPGDHKDIPVAVLQPLGQGPGLFLLAGAEMYRRLAQLLDPGMPVYGVFSQTEIDRLMWPADAATPRVSQPSPG